jgi:hypothetical protein
MKNTSISTAIVLLFAATFASAAEVTFTATPAVSGLTWEDSSSYATSATLSAGSAAPVTREYSVTRSKTCRALEVGGDGRIDSVEVSYSASSNAAVAGRSYIVTPQLVTYSGGGAPSAAESEFVRGDNAQFGRFRALERIFDGKTVAIGASFQPKKQDADELFEFPGGRVNSVALTLRSVASGVATFDISMSVSSDAKEKKSKKSAAGGMSMTLDGTLMLSVATSRPVSFDVSGPISVNVKKPNGARAADGSGTLSIHTEYEF